MVSPSIALADDSAVWLSLVALISKMLCFFATTRQSEQHCSGILRKTDLEIQRCARIPLSQHICQRHFDEIRRENERRCSCPSTWGHSKRLHPQPIPITYHKVLDQEGKTFPGYRPGTCWCNKCHKQAPKTYLSAESSNIPAKKQKVSIVVLITISLVYFNILF